MLTQYELVRIVQLKKAVEEYDGWGVNIRAPMVGDTGYLIDILSTSGYPNSYVVESSAPDGTTIWLGDFEADELKPVDDKL